MPMRRLEKKISGRQQPSRRRQGSRRSHIAMAKGIFSARSGSEKGSPPAPLKSRSIIRLFSISDEWVAACELSRRAGIHEATVNRFMHTLQEVGAVVHDEVCRYRCILFVMPAAQARPFTRFRSEAGADLGLRGRRRND